MDVQEILRRLRLREHKQNSGLKRLITSHTNLQEQVEQLKKEISKLEFEKQRLERFLENESDDATGSSRDSDQRALHKELIDAVKKKSEYADKICEMTTVLKAKEMELAQKDSRCRELEKLTTSLQDRLSTCEHNLANANRVNQTVMDENQTLQLLCNTQQSKYQDLEAEFEYVKQQLLMYKTKAAEDLNDENIRIKKHREEQLKKQQEEALKPKAPVVPLHVPPGDVKPPSEPLYRVLGPAICPTTPCHTFEAHDVEVSALCFSPDGNYMATGGGDKMVKVWNVKQDLGSADLKCSLSGSGGGIMSVQFDQSSKTVLAASNDSIARIWTISDQITRHTLAGHSGKVMTARFMEDNNKVVTGSHDRTLKIWDLQRGACIRTLFAGSSCNDVITGKYLGSTIISGHFDQRLRFWDVRTYNASEIALEGKITSLDYLPGKALPSAVLFP
ncbi:hypothetical protein EMCRGX_G021081 [Ephydatia muelleri]